MIKAQVRAHLGVLQDETADGRPQVGLATSIGGTNVQVQMRFAVPDQWKARMLMKRLDRIGLTRVLAAVMAKRALDDTSPGDPANWDPMHLMLESVGYDRDQIEMNDPQTEERDDG